MESVEILQYLKNEHLALMGRCQQLEAEVERLKAENKELWNDGMEVAEDYQDIGRELYYECCAHDATKAEVERLKARIAELEQAGDAMASALTDEMYSYSLDDPGNAAIMALLVKWREVRG